MVGMLVTCSRLKSLWGWGDPLGLIWLAPKAPASLGHEGLPFCVQTLKRPQVPMSWQASTQNPRTNASFRPKSFPLYSARPVAASKKNPGSQEHRGEGCRPRNTLNTQVRLQVFVAVLRLAIRFRNASVLEVLLPARVRLALDVRSAHPVQGPFVVVLYSAHSMPLIYRLEFAYSH